MGDKEKILKYLEQLGKAVTDCLNNADNVKDLIKLLEEQGLHLNLSFVAMISGSKPLAFPVSWGGTSKELKFEITPEDREFLQSLGIKYDDKAVEESEEDTKQVERPDIDADADTGEVGDLDEDEG